MAATANRVEASINRQRFGRTTTSRHREDPTNFNLCLITTSQSSPNSALFHGVVERVFHQNKKPPPIRRHILHLDEMINPSNCTWFPSILPFFPLLFTLFSRFLLCRGFSGLILSS